MNKKNTILKSLLSGTVLLSLLSTNPSRALANETSYNITSEIAKSEQSIQNLQLEMPSKEEEMIVLTGRYLPETEIDIKIGELDQFLVETDQHGLFELELKSVNLNNQTIQIIRNEKEELFLGTIITNDTKDLSFENDEELKSENADVNQVLEQTVEEPLEKTVDSNNLGLDDSERTDMVTFANFRSTSDQVKGTKYHFVQKNETLKSIAEEYKTTVAKIQEWNNISNPNQIKVGDLFSVNGLNVYSEINNENKSFANNQAFIDYIAPLAEEIAEEYGLYTSVMIAQAIHESAWGKSNLARLGNNLFGVKGSYDNNSVVMLTWEEKEDGSIIWIQDAFRFYPTYYESIIDNAEKLRYGVSWDSNYYRGSWIENTASHFDVTEWLTGRYATDSAYATKINRTIANYNLTKYDKHINITNPVTSQRRINRQVEVTGSNNNIYSQPKGTASDQLIGTTSNYKNKMVEVYQEKVNNLGTWWLIGQNGKEIGWVNRTTLSNNVYYTVTNTKSVKYSGTITKSLPINNLPAGTLGAKKSADVNQYINVPVNITQEKTTDIGTYALVSVNNQELGWIDKTAILLNTEVKSTSDKNYAAIVKQPWSINTEPFGTNGYKFIKDATDLIGKTVEVSQEKVTERSTYALLTYQGEELGWIDKGALEEIKVLNTKNVGYIAEVTRPWSINSQPWGVDGFKEVGNGASYLGQTFNVVQEKTTSRSTYLLLQKDGKNLGWVDQGAVKSAKDIKASRTVRYIANIVKPWSINSQPWGTKGFKTNYSSAQKFLGETVEVREEQLTARSTYALLTLNGKDLGWMDVTGIQKLTVTSTKNVNYEAEIALPWSINSLPWGVEGFKENYSSAQQFKGEIVRIKQEKTTPRSTYALVTYNGDDLGWIDKGALNLYPILSSKNTSYKAKVTKPWSINSQPWGTNGYRTVINNTSYVGKTIDIVQEKVTPRSTYGLINVNGKNIGWIDMTGVEKLRVISSKSTNYAAKVTKPWTINSQPWGTEGSVQVLDGQKVLGDTFIVTQEKTTPRSTYLLLTQEGKELGWIDVTGVEKQVVKKTNDVYYTAKVTKPWSINTEPWGTEGFKAIPNESDYIGGVYDIIQEKVTSRGTYGLLSKTGQPIGWIDLTGIEKVNTVKSMRKTSYTATLINPWSINTEPWGLVGSEVVHATSNQFVGKKLTVISEKVTQRSTYALIVIDSKIVGWIDKTALK